MSKNIMKEVTNLLGLELGEEFEILNSGYVYKIDKKQGIMYRHSNDKDWHISNVIRFEDFLMGEKEIIKLPWVPKRNEAYYRPSRKFFGVTSEVWTDNPYDYAFKEAGMIYRTEKECEAALPGLRKKYLGADYL
jgi:hypothetical protein